MFLVLGLEHSCPWPRECLSSERLSLALASDFFCVLGLGLEPCVLDSTSDIRACKRGGTITSGPKNFRRLIKITLKTEQRSLLRTQRADIIKTLEQRSNSNRAFSKQIGLLCGGRISQEWPPVDSVDSTYGPPLAGSA